MLIQVLIAIPLALLTLLGASQYYMMTQQSVTKVERQTDLNNLHAEVLHQAQSVTYLTTHVIFPAPYNIANPTLKSCLASASSTDCRAMLGDFPLNDDGAGAAGVSTFNSQKNRSGGPCVANGGAQPCVFNQTAKARWVCDDTRCGSLQIELTTTDIENTGGKYKSLRSLVNIPARAFVVRGEMDVSCAINQVVGSIDYTHLKVNCQDIPYINTTSSGTGGQYPAKSFSVTDPNNINNVPGASSCPDGFNTLGLFSSEQSCAATAGTYTTTYTVADGNYSTDHPIVRPPPPLPQPTHTPPTGGPLPGMYYDAGTGTWEYAGMTYDGGDGGDGS